MDKQQTYTCAVLKVNRILDQPHLYHCEGPASIVTAGKPAQSTYAVLVVYLNMICQISCSIPSWTTKTLIIRLHDSKERSTTSKELMTADIWNKNWHKDNASNIAPRRPAHYYSARAVKCCPRTADAYDTIYNSYLSFSVKLF